MPLIEAPHPRLAPTEVHLLPTEVHLRTVGLLSVIRHSEVRPSPRREVCLHAEVRPHQRVDCFYQKLLEVRFR